MQGSNRPPTNEQANIPQTFAQRASAPQRSLQEQIQLLLSAGNLEHVSNNLSSMGLPALTAAGTQANTSCQNTAAIMGQP